MKLNCVVCGINITVNSDNIMERDIIRGRITAGYGSIYDGDIFGIVVCDKCIMEKLESEGILKIGRTEITSMAHETVDKEYQEIF